MTRWCSLHAIAMATVKLSLSELEREYRAALQEYLLQGEEGSLHKGYELGRMALALGKGVLDMIALHDRASVDLLFQSSAPADPLVGLKKSNEFFAEVMSAFEMAHRAFGEANTALHHLNETMENEAKRIAHSLHDESGQLLAAIHIKLDEIARELPTQLRERIQEVRQVLDRIELDLRRISHELRPTILDDFGLPPAVEFLSEGIMRRTGLKISVESEAITRLPVAIETAIYRIVQEALNNVAKHSRAQRVFIRLSRQPNVVYCFVRDDGVGFDPKAISLKAEGRGLGLLGIRERLNAVGGSVQINSAPGRGTELEISVPLEV